MSRRWPLFAVAAGSLLVEPLNLAIEAWCYSDGCKPARILLLLPLFAFVGGLLARLGHAWWRTSIMVGACAFVPFWLALLIHASFLDSDAALLITAMFPWLWLMTAIIGSLVLVIPAGLGFLTRDFVAHRRPAASVNDG